MQVSKNIWRGGEITDLNELIKMANGKKSVVWNRGSFNKILPAAFIINWPLREIVKSKFHYAVHNTDIPEIEFSNDY